MAYYFPQIKVVSWSPLDPITAEKLNDMVNNDQTIQENMVRGRYTGVGASYDKGIRIASGLVRITARTAPSATVGVKFQNFFSDNCKPMVTTGIYSGKQREISVTLDGAGASLVPTNAGFNVTAYVRSTAKKKISNNFYVSWIALGY